jgi:hypothetical protein
VFGETPRKRFRDKVDLPTTRRRKKGMWFMEVSRIRVRVKRGINRGLGRRNRGPRSVSGRTYEDIND